MYKEIENVIEKYAKEDGYSQSPIWSEFLKFSRLSVVRTYTGHGVGQHFHCAPNVPHYAGNKTAGFMRVIFRLYLRQINWE